MIIQEGEDLFGQYATDCANCGGKVVDFPFISWDFVDSGSIARVAFHPTCAKKMLIGMDSDLYEIDAGH